ncbi:MAG: hypothetical protein MK207_16565, partial [Saprospiraceae bacterium]|nr:hypothetical protein [Saprospiraceae bacterium]
TSSASWSCGITSSVTASLGTLTASSNGGLAPYSYAWDGAASSATTSTVTGMPPGTYNVTVTDATGCTTTSSASWSCGITSSVTASLGTLTASSNGGLAPYSYAWDGAASSATTSTVTGMPLGTYNVTVTDANGCTATSSASYSCGLIVTVPEQLGTLHASPSVGVLPYSYQWDVAAGSQTTASVSGMPLEGAYTVTVTDADGCTATGTGNLVYNIGDYGPAGGIVFYLPPNATTDLNGDGVYDIGLECAPSDQGTAIWGCQGTNIPTATGIGSGAANTLAIEAGCTTPGTAADICANLSLGGYSDWFLPSKDELNAMYLLSAPWLTGPGGFSNADYWSSSQHTQYTAYRQGFWGGYVGNGLNKNDYSWHVRAVRAF